MKGEKMLEEARESYQSIERFLTIAEDDSTLVVIGKVILRIIGIFVMILLSPFLLVGLFIAFIAVL
jgi:hypothetical protein